MTLLVNLAVMLLNIIVLAIIVRALLSWFYQGMGRDPFTRVLIDVTEPLLAPVRSLLFRIIPIPIDFSPIVVILMIQLLQRLLVSAAYAG